ncbi:hypothetical protein BDY21DRAFT_362290 [Lineolata rhizophorae]|uniref:C3H1-type domain-containing protein n=1 Tax=Lineolata rhizophorae TaxID=578093 RepID=A0A6A6P6G0_9PEZI|nr:hypothetical protein BDY21DRAFT_362290 [Lineolata rhizophorae]
MVVCKFFLQGNCKFGKNCRFDHPTGGGAQNWAPNQNAPRGPPQGQSRSQNQSQTQTRFGQPQPQHDVFRGPQSRNQPRGGNRRDARDLPLDNLPYLIVPDAIETDLRFERPLWPCSAYGPGRDAPRQLFGGYPIELSPEELRAMFYKGMSQGDTAQAIQLEKEADDRVQQHIHSVLRDIPGACRYIIDGEHEHPNRIDICKATTSGRQQSNIPGGDAAFMRSTPTASPGTSNLGVARSGWPAPIGGTQQQGGVVGFGHPSLVQAGPASGGGFGAPSFPTSQPNQQQQTSFLPQGQTLGTFQSSSPFDTEQSAFQVPSGPTSFGVLSGPNATAVGPSPFSRPAQPGTFGPNPFANGFSQPSAPIGPLPAQNAAAPMTNGATGGETTRDARTGKLSTWHGEPVQYIDGKPCRREGNDWKRILFPDGPPSPVQGAYGSNHTEEEKAAYEAARAAGSFPNGIIPLEPPSWDMLTWDM